MRVLLHAATEVGRRLEKVLLAESDIDYIGLWKAPNRRTAKRTGPVTDVDDFDVAVTDAPGPIGDLAARCAVGGIPLVVWVDDPGVPPGSALIPIVAGANVGAALPAALLTHPAARPEPGEDVVVAWTEPGTTPRRGELVAFPEPVGVVRATERGPGAFAAPRSDQWGGAVVRVGPEEEPRVVGVADHAAHLEALVLAATVLVAADGVYEPGLRQAADAGEQLLNALRRVELDIAAWRSHS